MSDRINAALGAMHRQINNQQQMIDEMRNLLSAAADTPSYIDQIPGRRVPYWAEENLVIAASSTARVEASHSVSADGPFVCTGLAAFYQRTEGPYAGPAGPVTTVDSRIAAVGQQHGAQYLFDQPHAISGDFEIIDRGSDRQWQNRPISSGLLATEVGGMYVLPIANLFGTNSSITLAFTPGFELPYAGLVKMILCGYKIVQGQNYQP
jgi:hypothetical protein